MFIGLILNIFKPQGLTSFGVVKSVRKASGVKKVGHAGGLDPFATGVLLVCLGSDTKKISEFMELKKEYEGVIEFGIVTDTYDLDGKIIEIKTVKEYSMDFLEENLSKFTGTIDQVPPMYSAIKYLGKPLYKIARANRIIDRKARKVTIYSIKILKYINPFLTFRVICSKGTYIRSMAYDVGKILGCGAYLKSLTRTKIGDYSIYNSLFLGDVENYFKNQNYYGNPA